MDSIFLMANSGIQFYSTEAVFLPSEPAVVNDIPLPQLLFGEYPSDLPDQNEIQIVYRFHNKQSHEDLNRQNSNNDSEQEPKQSNLQNNQQNENKAAS